jgi:hypothetical protein
MRDGKYYSPYNRAISGISKATGCLDPTIVDVVIKRMTSYFIENLPDHKLKPVTMSAAINGIKTDDFFKRINTSTGSGFGLIGKKGRHLPIVDEDECIREPTSEIKKMVNKMIQSYEGGISCAPISEGLLKDEPRSRAKVEIGKVRMFYSVPLSYLVICRMFLHPLFTLIVEKSELFQCAIGINMHSSADALFRTLSEWSPYIMEGDYSAFDQSMAFAIGHGVATVYVNLLKHFGYNSFSIQIVKGLLTDDLFPLVVILKDLFCAPGLKTSGGLGTAENNCTRNLFMKMYAWYLHPMLKEKDFFEYVMCRDYGDDLLVSVKEDVLCYFNNIYYQKVCVDVFRINYTAPDKSDKIQPYYPIKNSTFLKRSFLYREDLKRWVSPLNLDSIWRACLWQMPSSVVSEEQQVLALYTSMLWEFFLWKPEREYNEIRSEMLQIYRENYINIEDDELPTYYQIHGRIFK